MIELTPTMDVFRQALDVVGLNHVVDSANQLSTAYTLKGYSIGMRIVEQPEKGLVYLFGFFDGKVDSCMEALEVAAQVNHTYSDAVFMIDTDKEMIAYRTEAAFIGVLPTVEDCKLMTDTANAVMQEVHPYFFK